MPMEYTYYATDPALPAIHAATHIHASLTQSEVTTSTCDDWLSFTRLVVMIRSKVVENWDHAT